MIKIGDKLPDINMKIIEKGETKDVQINNYFSGKKIVLFSVPGAFTPTCSAKHLPGFLKNIDKIKNKGIDEVVCLAVNDPFVMHAWGQKNNALKDITFLADGNADFSKEIGLVFDGSSFGLGIRSQRFAMVINACNVENLFIEKAGAFEVSSAEYVFSKL